jgi:hypothetical protein
MYWARSLILVCLGAVQLEALPIVSGEILVEDADHPEPGYTVQFTFTGPNFFLSGGAEHSFFGAAGLAGYPVGASVSPIFYGGGSDYPLLGKGTIDGVFYPHLQLISSYESYGGGFWIDGPWFTLISDRFSYTVPVTFHGHLSFLTGGPEICTLCTINPIGPTVSYTRSPVPVRQASPTRKGL